MKAALDILKDFPALTHADWLAAVEMELKGKPFVNKTARITIELSGRTLENLIALAVKLHRHPDDLTVDLLYAAIEASVGQHRGPSGAHGSILRRPAAMKSNKAVRTPADGSTV
jgi:hypothetical protein